MKPKQIQALREKAQRICELDEQSTGKRWYAGGKKYRGLCICDVDSSERIAERLDPDDAEFIKRAKTHVPDLAKDLDRALREIEDLQEMKKRDLQKKRDDLFWDTAVLLASGVVTLSFPVGDNPSLVFPLICIAVLILWRFVVNLVAWLRIRSQLNAFFGQRSP